MRIERAEVIPLEVPLTRTFYGGTYSMNRRCTLLLRVWTAEGVRGQIYIGDERDEQAVVCRILREQLFPCVLGRQASEVTAIWEENFRRTMVLSDGDWSIFLRRPISLGFLLLAAALLLAVTLPNIRRSREEAFRE